MDHWLIVENIIIVIAFVLVVIFAPGWWKLTALVLAAFINYTRYRKG